MLASSLFFVYILAALCVCIRWSTHQSILSTEGNKTKRCLFGRSFDFFSSETHHIVSIIAETNSPTQTRTHTHPRIQSLLCVDNNENPSRTVACGKVTDVKMHTQSKRSEIERKINIFIEYLNRKNSSIYYILYTIRGWCAPDIHRRLLLPLLLPRLSLLTFACDARECVLSSSTRTYG